MNSIFKASLFVTALAFAAPAIAHAATAQDSAHAHKYYKGHQHSKKAKKSGTYRNAKHHQMTNGDAETADLNARSLQTVQSYNSTTVPVGSAPSLNQGPNPQVIIAPGTGNTMQAPMAPVNNTMQQAPMMAPVNNTMPPPMAPAGNVNPNNMPPVAQ